MELNANFSKRAVVHAARVSWVPSPIAGVERRMLDRIGEEVSRATSIVRYAPNSHFSAHTHGGGEEFLVLDGVFSDEHGDFPAGSYIRNPPGSRHTPGSDKGCTIFVKLWQFDPEDRTHLRIDATKMPFLAARDRQGVEILPLYQDAHENVRLERWSADAQIFLPATGGVEILVLEGSFGDGNETFEPLSWLRLPADAMLTARSGANGCKSLDQDRPSRAIANCARVLRDLPQSSVPRTQTDCLVIRTAFSRPTKPSRHLQSR